MAPRKWLHILKLLELGWKTEIGFVEGMIQRGRNECVLILKKIMVFRAFKITNRNNFGISTFQVCSTQ
ncbi:MAG: hypothetical protein XD41_2083 [Desulfonauticus sp. 38_4375]|nr:MAG: hypothetical protein XD41_2083 [Desulfonauticus sp. 38_4375]